MRSRIVFQLSQWIGTMIAMPFGLSDLFVHRSTTNWYAKSRQELLFWDTGPFAVNSFFESEESGPSEQGWKAVHVILRSTQTGELGKDFNAVVFDSQFRIKALSDRDLFKATVDESDNGVVLSLEITGEVLGRSMSLGRPRAYPLTQSDGNVAGRLIPFCGPVKRETGEPFALRMWPSSAWWLVLTVGQVKYATAFVFQRALLPFRPMIFAFEDRPVISMNGL